MTVKPRALIVCPESPYPPVGGGPLRTGSVLEYLRTKYDVEMVVFQEPGGTELPAAKMIPLRRHSRTPAARLLRNLSRAIRGVPPLNDRFAGYALPLEREYKLALFEHFWCAGYLNSVAAEQKWLDLHNIESAFYDSGAIGPAAPLMRRFAQCALRMERELFPRFTGILVASDADAERVERIAPGCRVLVLPNTIPTVPRLVVVKRPEIVFSGNLEYEPNRQGIRYFRHIIWPKLRKLGVRWRVIGKNPEAVSRILAGDSHIELTGPVEDAIREIAWAQVSVVPLLSGSGTRMKIIEAWAAGTPVVSTTVGAEGLPGTSEEHLLIRDDPERFAAAVCELVKNESLAVRLAGNGRSLYERELTWRAAANRLSAVGL
jgi:polysaccharide biosynthesis protein PslH